MKNDKINLDSPLSEVLDDSIVVILSRVGNDGKHFQYGMRTIPGNIVNASREEFSTLLGMAYGMMQLSAEDPDLLLTKGDEYFEAHKAEMMSDMELTEEEKTLLNMKSEGEG